jgi:hypothetical protein
MKKLLLIAAAAAAIVIAPITVLTSPVAQAGPCVPSNVGPMTSTCMDCIKANQGRDYRTYTGTCAPDYDPPGSYNGPHGDPGFDYSGGNPYAGPPGPMRPPG